MLAGNDGNDSMRRPAFLIKASPLPLVYAIYPEGSSDLGFEMRIAPHFTVGINGGVAYSNPFFRFSSHQHGYFFSGEFRYYFPKRNGTYLSFSPAYNCIFFSPNVDFKLANGEYLKEVSYTEQTNAFCVYFGMEGNGEKSRWPLDFSIGAGAGYRYGNAPGLNADEINFIDHNSIAGLKGDKTGWHVVPVVNINARICFIIRD
ncbi:MAG TPA: hypothetical protein VFU15_14680 [Bacteroidia bacterium]|nr:hypothetical protein [Bacteroidia bacterium]